MATLFVLALALVALWELHRMVTGDGRLLAQGLLALGGAAVVAVALTATSGTGFGLVALATGGWVVAMLAPRGAAWLAIGSIYMVGALCLLLGLRVGAGPARCCGWSSSSQPRTWAPILPGAASAGRGSGRRSARERPGRVLLAD